MERLTVRNSEGIAVLRQPFACERCGDLQWSLPDLGNGSPIDRLTEYEDLEEQGKLLKLPCMYGETVFVIPTKENSLLKITKMKCLGFYIGEPNNTANLFPVNRKEASVKMYQPDFNDFNKIVFLTLEAAEAALKGVHNE